MCLCGAVVILHFAQMDPLNPKPITEDLSSVLLQGRPPHWRLQQHIQRAPGLPLASCLAISLASSVPGGCW